MNINERLVIQKLIRATKKNKIKWEYKTITDEYKEHFEGLYSNIESILHTKVNKNEYLIVTFQTPKKPKNELLIFKGPFMKVAFETIISDTPNNAELKILLNHIEHQTKLNKDYKIKI